MKLSDQIKNKKLCNIIIQNIFPIKIYKNHIFGPLVEIKISKKNSSLECIFFAKADLVRD